jgi:biotin synthase
MSDSPSAATVPSASASSASATAAVPARPRAVSLPLSPSSANPNPRVVPNRIADAEPAIDAAAWRERVEASVRTGSVAVAGRFAAAAEASLAGRALSRDEAAEVLSAPDSDLPELLSAAFAVRHRRFGRRVKLCMLLNAKSGLCPEDCGYCSQAKGVDTGVDKYRLLDEDSIVARAEAAAASGAKRFCIVCSGRGPSDKDIAHLSAAVKRIKSARDLEICCSLGLMSRPQAERLREAGVDYVNHNLNTSRSRYSEICSTHTYDDRLDTIENVRAAGMSTCSGGIVGMGETDADIIELAEEVRRMDIASIPVNFLIAFDGTPMEGRQTALPWQRGLKTLCLMRLMNPDKEIRMAAGRERKLGRYQWLSLYPANSVFVDGYLTTEGDAAARVREMIESSGFEVEV